MSQRETQRYTLPRPHEGTDVAVARLWAAGALGVWERPDELVAWFTTRPDDVPSGGRWDVEEDRDWQEEWKAGIAPVTAGRFVVVPTWLADELGGAPGQRRIVLDPGRAFGSGHHATTTQCLELLEDVETEVEGARVLDVGTGTGILAIGAAQLGAAEVVAVDVDAEAVEVTRENAERNGVEIAASVGSIDTAGTGAPFDVVLANLVTDTIVSLAGALVGATRPGGVLIASGIADERADRAVAALREAGLDDIAIVQREGWTALSGRRSAGTPA